MHSTEQPQSHKFSFKTLKIKNEIYIWYKIVDCVDMQKQLSLTRITTLMNYVHCSYLSIKIAYFFMNNDMVKIASQTHRKVTPSFLM